MIRFILLVLVTLAFSSAPAQAQRAVAVTLDDLPYAGRNFDDARHATADLLTALAAHEVSADVFTIKSPGICVRVDGEGRVGSCL
jgi:hypothetical protein